jgi:ribosomal protein L44E
MSSSQRTKKRPAAILVRECPKCQEHTSHTVVEVGDWEHWACTVCRYRRQYRVR